MRRLALSFCAGGRERFVMVVAEGARSRKGGEGRGEPGWAVPGARPGSPPLPSLAWSTYLPRRR